jgi:flagellar biosynthesis/type III secretory pathway protein FliH
MAEGVKHIEFLADEKVIAGGVLIETNTGIVDARLETQLVEIAKNLLEVASNGD